MYAKIDGPMSVFVIVKVNRHLLIHPKLGLWIVPYGVPTVDHEQDRLHAIRMCLPIFYSKPY